jgi:acetyl esterase/lipase
MDTAYWDDAYTNSAYIPGGSGYADKWASEAAQFREAMTKRKRALLDQPYGSRSRERFDLFLPEAQPRGLFVFVHGGYWMQFDKSSWSHLASGALDRGWAVALPSYTLCPEVRVSEITRQIAQAIATISDRVAGPVMLAGHSAGGHLVSRMGCAESPLPDAVRPRIRHIVSISGLHDLRPLMRTSMNQTLRLDEAEAMRESPALLRPMTGARVTCWVGSAERPEFLRQNALLANIWTGLGARMAEHQAKGRHHFDVIEELTDSGSPLTSTLLDA